MKTVNTPVTFALMVGTRGFFNAQLAREGRTDILKRLAELGYRSVILPEGATASGAVESYADAMTCAELFQKRREDIDGVLVVLPNFGDEVAIASALNLAKLDVPVLVIACDDEVDKVDLNHRRDAFCGKISVCNNLYQYGIPFTDTTYHTYSLAGQELADDLRSFAAVCRTVRGLRSARIGAIGARPAAFQTMRASEKLLQATGITVVPVDLSEILSAAQKMGDSPELASRLKEIGDYGRIPSSIVRENLTKQAKLGLAIEAWMEKNLLDAAAVQCWSSIQENYGCATCLTMSMLGEKLMPAACEVDIAGVISMYGLVLASGSASAILDWNNNYGADRDMCVCTHCSNYPKSFMGNEIEISNLDILGKSLGPDRCFGAIKGRVAPGHMTYFRLSTDDRRGKIKMYTGEGDFTDDPFPMDGGIAVTRVKDLQALMKYIVKNGFEHHVAMVRGSVAADLAEACGTYLGWEVYHHGKAAQAGD